MIKLGVIGFGARIAGVINYCMRNVDESIRVVGIVDPDEAGVRQRLAECDRDSAVFYKDIATMMKKANVDALVIGTRCNLHTQYAIEASRYPVPLYLEKPVAINMKQALALERAAEKAKNSVVVSFPLRVSPLCLKARQLLKEGVVGHQEHVLATNYVNYGTVYWEEEYRNYAITGGLFLQKATHDLDYLMFLMDSPIFRVAAMSTTGHIFGGKKRKGLTCARCKEIDTCLESPKNRQRHHTTGTQGDHPCLFSVDCGTPETGLNEDSSSCLIEFANGVHGVYTQVFYTRRDASRRGAVISGYMGTLDFDWYRNDIRLTRHHEPFSETVQAGQGMSHFGGDRELAIDFIDLIHGSNTTSRAPIEAGIQSVYTCLAARESALKGKFVKVRQVGQTR